MQRVGRGRVLLVALAVVVALAVAGVVWADRARSSREAAAAAEAARPPALVRPDGKIYWIREGDSSIRPGDLYSYLSVTVCLDKPGAVRVTGAELDPDAVGVELVDVRVRKALFEGWGSKRGTLDGLPFKANPGNVVSTTCDGGDPPDQVGLTVRRTGQQVGRATKVRFTYEAEAGHRTATTDWFANRWTFGPTD